MIPNLNPDRPPISLDDHVQEYVRLLSLWLVSRHADRIDGHDRAMLRERLIAAHEQLLALLGYRPVGGVYEIQLMIAEEGGSPPGAQGE